MTTMPPFPSPTSIWHDTAYDALSLTRPELSAKGKTVVITGGGTGIGAETARYFAEAGASRIALLGRRERPLLDTKASIEHRFIDVEVFVASVDITIKTDLDAALSRFCGAGQIHVMVSNASILGPHESAIDVDTDIFVDAVQQNLRGSLNVAQAFVRHAAKDAVAIDVNSFAAYLNFGAAFAAYSVSKLTAFRLWDTVACANPELSVFHVQPGMVDTDLNREAGMIKALGFQDNISLPASFNVWLASPEARFLKGKFVWANWDVDELKAQAKDIQGSERFSIGLGGWPFQV